jgi:subtilisin family serine protease
MDEAATVDRVASEGVWLPLMRPAWERRFDLALVTDATPSMAVWSQNLRELRLLLEQLGAFRDVRLWRLTTDAAPEAPLVLHAEHRGAAHQPRELASPDGQRVILVVSDCVGRSWRDGRVRHLLESWGQVGPVAILQPLPETSWQQTGLGGSQFVSVRAPAGGVPNRALRVEPLGPSLTRSSGRPPGIPIPVLTFEPDSLRAWAKLVVGEGEEEVTACLLPEGSPETATTRQQEAEDRWHRFASTASDGAKELAALFGASPSLRLPVLRLAQRSVLPETGPTELAEVVLGGLFRLASPAHPTDPDAVELAFHDGVRELLVKKAPFPEAVDVFNTVSRYVGKRFGVAAVEFQAFVADAGAAVAAVELSSALKPFAEVAAHLLRRLGGMHAETAGRLERVTAGSKLPAAAAAAVEPGQETPAPAPSTFQQERGDRSLVSLVADGIDVLHQTFQDAAGRSRILEIWDQNDPTGPTPHVLYGPLAPDYGTVHTESDLQSYLTSGVVPARLGRNPAGYGTRVASLAAGRAVESFGGGLASESRIVVVILESRINPGDSPTLGSPTSIAEALAYVRQVARARELPVVVLFPLGMDIGAHDGTSPLEQAFDAFSDGGRQPGLVVVTTAGNARDAGGHARFTLASSSRESLRWTSPGTGRSGDLIDLWFRPEDALSFRLRDPAGYVSALCDRENPTVQGAFPSGNTYALTYTRHDPDNGDSRLLVSVWPGEQAESRKGSNPGEILTGFDLRLMSALNDISGRAPALALNGEGRLELFVRGHGGALWLLWQEQRGGAWLKEPFSFGSAGGGFTGTPALALNGEDRLEVFARGQDGALWHRWQEQRGGAWSTGWVSLGAAGGGFAGAPALALNGEGRLELFVRGQDGALWHRWQEERGGPWSTAWASRGSAGGGFASAPALALNGDGRLELFVRGRDGALWHCWQEQQGGAWSEWLSHGGVDLRWMSALNDVSGIPTEGRNLIIVAAVNHLLHFRIFDGDGKLVVDIDEKSLADQAQPIEELRKHLESLGPPHEMTRSEKDQVVTAVTSIIGRTLSTVSESDDPLITPGVWSLEVSAGRLRSPHEIHAWIVHNETRATRFLEHVDENCTLTIPGTARSVLTIGAAESEAPRRASPDSSAGPTRDGRNKPEIVAPGGSTLGAKAGTNVGMDKMRGTSTAAAHVAGAVALVLSRAAKRANAGGIPIPSANEIRAALIRTARHYNADFRGPEIS